MRFKSPFRRLDEWTRSDPENRKPVRLSLVFLFGFIFSFAVVSGLTWLFAAYETAQWLPWLHEPRLSQDKLFEVIRNAVTTAAALGVGITLFFSYRRQRTTEATQRITAEAQLTAAEAQETAAKALELSNKQYELERERRQDAVVAELRSRYSRAADQLSAEALTIRLAGVFALATLADDWDRQEDASTDRQTCIDLLLATYRALDSEDESDATETKSAIWRSVMDRFRMHSAGRRWAGSHIDFSGLRHANSSVLALRVDGSLNFSRTSSDGGATFYVQGIVLAQRGVLSFNGASHGGLEFRSCVFDSGRLDLTNVSVEQRIVFVECSFNGTYVVLDGAARGKNVEFISCSFNNFPNHIRRPAMRKLKFVDCVVATQVMGNEEDASAEGSVFFDVHPFDLVVRGTRFEGDAPEIEAMSDPGDLDLAEHGFSRGEQGDD